MVAEAAFEQGDDPEIAHARRWINIGRRAAVDALGDLQYSIAQSDPLADEVKLAPWAKPFNIDIGAKTQRINAAPVSRTGDGINTGEIDDREEAGLAVHEAVARR